MTIRSKSDYNFSYHLLDVEYGVEVTRLLMAAYLADERSKTIALTDPHIPNELETYIPLIQQGRGAEILFG